MKVVEGYAHLYLNNGRYSVRLQVPKRAQERVGKGELKSALGGDFVVAKKRYPAALGKLRAVVDDPGDQTIAPGHYRPSTYDIDHAVRSFHAKLPERIARSGSGNDSEIEQANKMVDLAVLQTSTRSTGTMALQARWLCQEMGWEEPDGSPVFDEIKEKLLRARLDRLRAEKHRTLALFTDRTDADPLFSAEAGIASRKRAATVGQLVELYRRVREPNLAGSTVKNYRIALRALEEIAGTHTPLSSINRERCRQIRDTLAGLPSNYRKLPQTRDMSITDAVAAGRKLKLPTVKPATLNGYTTKLCALFKLAVKEEWVASNPATDLTVNDPVSPKQKRHPFSSEQLDAIFAGEPWASNERDVDGRPARFWLPILALYTGARLGELAQLATADVGMRSGVQVIEVRAGDETRLKTDNAERTIPVHSELVRMGFLKFVEEARNAARPRLFPQELRNGLGQYGRGVSDWFARLLDRRGITDKKLTFHSFRHNFEDALRDADLHGGPIGAYLSGRSVGGVAASYGDGYSATKLRDAIERVQYPDLDLSHLHHAPVD